MRFPTRILATACACALASLSLMATSGVALANGNHQLCVNPHVSGCYKTIRAAVTSPHGESRGLLGVERHALRPQGEHQRASRA
jgi:hypothetical protein